MSCVRIRGRTVYGVKSGRSHHASGDDGSGSSDSDPGPQSRDIWTGRGQIKEALTTGERDPASGRKRTVSDEVGIT